MHTEIIAGRVFAATAKGLKQQVRYPQRSSERSTSKPIYYLLLYCYHINEGMFHFLIPGICVSSDFRLYEDLLTVPLYCVGGSLISSIALHKYRLLSQ